MAGFPGLLGYFAGNGNDGPTGLLGDFLPADFDKDAYSRSRMSNGLLSAGLGILANNGPGATFGQAFGRGTLQGLNSMDQADSRLMRDIALRAQLSAKDNTPVVVPKGGTLYNRGGQKLAEGAPDLPTGMVVGPNGPMYMPEYLQGQEEIRRAGKPDTTVRIENQLGGGLAGNVKDIVEGTRQSALGAVDTLNTTGRIRDAIAAGNVNLGPGASLQQGWDQVANKLGISGATTDERLANTRQVMKGLAEMTLNARKSLKGQGQVSDYEGRLLQRAASGEIDTFTMPEIKAFLDVTDRLAGKQYAMHGANLTRMNDNPDLKGLAPFYEVPPLPQYTPAAPQANTDPLGLFK